MHSTEMPTLEKFKVLDNCDCLQNHTHNRQTAGKSTRKYRSYSSFLEKYYGGWDHML